MHRRFDLSWSIASFVFTANFGNDHYELAGPYLVQTLFCLDDTADGFFQLLENVVILAVHFYL